MWALLFQPLHATSTTRCERDSGHRGFL